jgi:hypothetical protein
MTDRHITQVDDADEDFETDDQGRPICPGCGEPLVEMNEGDIFAAKMDTISGILDKMMPWDQGTAITLLMAEHLGALVKPRARKSVRDEMIRQMDDLTAEVIARVKASRRRPTQIEQLALLPTVPNTGH